MQGQFPGNKHCPQDFSFGLDLYPKVYIQTLDPLFSRLLFDNKSGKLTRLTKAGTHIHVYTF